MMFRRATTKEILRDQTLRRNRAEVIARNVQPKTDNYVAYCRFTDSVTPNLKAIVTCDANAPKAFKVYRHPPSFRDVDLSQNIKKWRSMNGLDFGSATYFKCADELEGLLNG